MTEDRRGDISEKKEDNGMNCNILRSSSSLLKTYQQIRKNEYIASYGTGGTGRANFSIQCYQCLVLASGWILKNSTFTFAAKDTFQAQIHFNV